MDKENKSKVVLRALEPEDLDLLYGIENNPEVWDVSPTNVPLLTLCVAQLSSKYCE